MREGVRNPEPPECPCDYAISWTEANPRRYVTLPSDQGVFPGRRPKRVEDVMPTRACWWRRPTGYLFAVGCRPLAARALLGSPEVAPLQTLGGFWRFVGN